MKCTLLMLHVGWSTPDCLRIDINSKVSGSDLTLRRSQVSFNKMKPQLKKQKKKKKKSKLIYSLVFMMLEKNYSLLYIVF